MTSLVAQSQEQYLFRDEPGAAWVREAHRKLAVAIREVLVSAGMVVEVWTIVVNVYLIATQDWASYYRMKVMEHVDDMLEPWLAKSKQIGQTEEEQAALMDEMFSEWGKRDPRFLKFVGVGSQSITEVKEMDNDKFQEFMAKQDELLAVMTAIHKANSRRNTVSLKQQIKNNGVFLGAVGTSLVLALSAVGTQWLWADSKFETVATKDDLSKVASHEYVNGEFKALRTEMNGNFQLLNQRLDFGVPKPGSVSSATPTSTDTR